MSMNFHFTQIPDETNVIFLKSPKTMFLGNFWPFLVIFSRCWFFPKNLALPLITKCGSLTLCAKFQNKLWANSEKTYGQMEGRTDRPYFKGPFRPRPGVQKKHNRKYKTSMGGFAQMAHILLNGFAIWEFRDW